MKKLLLLPLCFLCACDPDPSLLEKLSGPYVGLEKATNMDSKGGSSSTQVQVQIDIQTNHLLAVRIANKDGSARRTFQISIPNSGNHLDIQGLPGLGGNGLGTVTVKKDSSTCWGNKLRDDKSGTQLVGDLCLRDKELSFDLGLTSDFDGKSATYSLLLNRPDGHLEEPTQMTLSELFHRTLVYNFDTRLQYHKFVQAKLARKNARGNLLPHLTINSILGLATFTDIMGALNLIGDLAPFLLPNRWEQAREAKEMAKYNKTTLFVMRADAAQATEGLGLSIIRDEKILQLLKDQYAKVAKVKKQISFREGVGQFDPGSTDRLQSVLNGLDDDMLVMQDQIREAYDALAVGAGFVNPDAISKLVYDYNDSIEKPYQIKADSKILSEMDFKNLAVAKSAALSEMRQVDELEEVARLNTMERRFNWADPSGDNMAGLGAGWFPYVETGKRARYAAKDQRKQVESTVRDKADDALEFSELALKRYEVALKNIKTQDSLVKHDLRYMNNGLSLPLLRDLADSYIGQTQAEIKKISLDFEYQMNLSRIRRLAFLDQYQELEKNQDAYNY